VARFRWRRRGSRAHEHGARPSPCPDQFLVRVGEFGGCAVIETDVPTDIHQLTSAFAVFRFRVEPVMDVMDAVAAESEAITWRDGLAQA
jgi:hypothetical protein